MENATPLVKVDCPVTGLILYLKQANIPVSYTVTHVPPQGLTTPLCSGQHLPPTCSSQQQVPSCNVVISAGQHYHPVRLT